MLVNCTETAAPFQVGLPLYSKAIPIRHPYIGIDIAQAKSLLTAQLDVDEHSLNEGMFLLYRGVQRVCVYAILKSKGVLDTQLACQPISVKPSDFKKPVPSSDVQRFKAHADIMLNVASLDIPYTLREISEATPFKVWQSLSLDLERKHQLLYYESCYGVRQYHDMLPYTDWASQCERIFKLCPTCLGREATLTAMLYHFYTVYRSTGVDEESSMSQRGDEALPKALSIFKTVSSPHELATQITRATNVEALEFRFLNAMRVTLDCMLSYYIEPTPRPATAVSPLTRSLRLK